MEKQTSAAVLSALRRHHELILWMTSSFIYESRTWHPFAVLSRAIESWKLRGTTLAELQVDLSPVRSAPPELEMSPPALPPKP